MNAAAVADIKVERKRHHIEARYQLIVDTLLQQYDFHVRLMKVELQMNCHVVKALRDAELRELEREA